MIKATEMWEELSFLRFYKRLLLSPKIILVCTEEKQILIRYCEDLLF